MFILLERIFHPLPFPLMGAGFVPCHLIGDMVKEYMGYEFAQA
jgi:hypothetical protein